MSCGAENEANDLMDELLEGEDFEIPNLDLSGPEFTLPTDNTIREPIAKMKNSDLTTRAVGGLGTFDVVMTSMREHLKDEYEKNRITGAEYTKAYIALVDTALGNSVQFLLQRDEAYWKSKMAQIAAVTAAVQLATAKMDFALKRTQVKEVQATFALAKMKLASESMAYCLAKNELEVLRPLQATGLTTDNTGKLYTVNNMMPAQLALLREQTEAARAQTLDTRTDGNLIVGSLGKQKDLYTQQIKSYQDDGKYKVAKLFTDSWITQKTIDEGLLPPNQFSNANIDVLLGQVRSGVGI